MSLDRGYHELNISSSIELLRVEALLVLPDLKWLFDSVPTLHPLRSGFLLSDFEVSIPISTLPSPWKQNTLYEINLHEFPPQHNVEMDQENMTLFLQGRKYRISSKVDTNNRAMEPNSTYKSSLIPPAKTKLTQPAKLLMIIRSQPLIKRDKPKTETPWTYSTIVGISFAYYRWRTREPCSFHIACQNTHHVW